MKKLLLGLACAATMTTASASGIAFGTDAIKLLDYGQFNIIAQNALNEKSALLVGGTVGDGVDLDVAYKAYTQTMYDSVYYQIGGVFTNLGGDGDTDIGIAAKIGYEHSPALHFVFYGAVAGTYFLDSNNIQYTPELGVMFTL